MLKERKKMPFRARTYYSGVCKKKKIVENPRKCPGFSQLLNLGEHFSKVTESFMRGYFLF